MIEISMVTALYIYIFCFVSGLIYMSILFFVTKSEKRMFVYFTLFFGLSLLGAVLTLFRGEWPDFVTIMMANSLIVLGHMMLTIAVRRIYDLSDNVLFYVFVFSLYVLAMLYFIYFKDSIPARIYVLNIATIILLGYGLFSLVKNKNSETPINQVMAIAFVSIMLGIVIRLMNFSLVGEDSDNFLLYQRDSFYIVIISISSLFVIPGILSIVKDKDEILLFESERSKSSLLSNLPGFAFSCVCQNNVIMTFLSDGFENITGYEKEVFVGKKEDYLNIIRDKDENLVLFKRCQIESGKGYTIEYPIITKQGHMKWLREQGICVKNLVDGKTYIEGYVGDITLQKQLEEDLKGMIFIDPLTQLQNRRGLNSKAKDLYKQSRRDKTLLSLMMIDLDDFKKVNDAFGHTFGDIVLREVATELQSVVYRPFDVVSRYGGEEFLILLHQCDQKNAIKKTEQIRNNIAALEQKYKRTKEVSVSVSVGLVTTNDFDNYSFEQLIEKADEAMYASKAKGKNCVTSVLYKTKK